jgi:hypothetical protein
VVASASRLSRGGAGAVTALVVIAFVVLIGPLAVLYGADSRRDDRRDGWPGTRR